MPTGREAPSRGRIKELLARAGLKAMWSTADLEAERRGAATPGTVTGAEAPGAACACERPTADKQLPAPEPPAPPAAPSLYAHALKLCLSCAFPRDQLCVAVAAARRQPRAAAEAAVDALLQQGQLEPAANGALAAADPDA